MRVSVSLKIFLIVLLVILMQTITLLYKTYNDLLRDQKELQQSSIHNNMSRLQQTLEFLWKKREYEQIQTELSYYAPLHNVEKISFMDDDDRIVASSYLAEIGESFPGVIPGNDGFPDTNSLIARVRQTQKSMLIMNQDETRMLGIYPVNLGLDNESGTLDEKIGVAIIVTDLKWLYRFVNDSIRDKAVYKLSALGIVGALLVFLLSHFFVVRIRNVRNAAKEFLDSGYRSRAIVRGKDEVSELANSFNEMAETVARKNSELVKKEEDISLMMDFMENGVISINEKGIIKSFNKSAVKMFGYNEEEIIGKNVKILMPEPYQSEHDMYLKHYIDTGVTNIIGTGRDLVALHKDGHEFSMHLKIAEMPTHDKKERMFIGSCLDMTMQKEQEAQLRQSQKMDAMGKLTGGIAHDYNNMLGVILGYAELIRDELGDSNPRVRKYIDEIYHAGNRGAKLTKKLLSFSRQKSAESTVVNINNVLNDNRHMLERTLTVRVQLKIEQEKHIWPVLIDSDDLEDAILNICINAMHAMEGRGVIRMITRNVHFNDKEAQHYELNSGAGDYVCLIICDTGCGMDEETLGKIFDPFYSTKKDQGTGLGLSQVYGFMKRSNGTVTVESELDKGTCFYLYFPRYLAHIDSTRALDLPQAIEQGKESVLVVDDEPALAELMNDILTSQGYAVSMANSGKEALELLTRGHFDLLISDILMPEMDGYQLAKEVKNLYPHIRIQLVSGFSDDQNKKYKDLELRSRILYKPFDRQQLLHSVRVLLDESIS